MRISVFVDGANLFYLQKDNLGWWIDLQKLLAWLNLHKGEVIDAVYYIGEDIPQEGRQQAFLDRLAHMGYSLVTKPIKNVRQYDGGVNRKANLDIEIVLDMFNTIDHYDLAVLVSGDGDFERALDMLKARGKRFLILSSEGTIATETRRLAGMHFVDFQSIRSEVEK